MAKDKTKGYDDEALVTAIAAGEMSYSQIARKLGISRTLVQAVARGERRPMLYERIQAASVAFREQGCRLASRMVTPAIGRLVQLIGPTSDAPAEVQRKAAVDLLKFAFGHGLVGRSLAGFACQWGNTDEPAFFGLSPQLREQVLSELGAPPKAGEMKDDGE